jgi:DNA-binding CsgD family transcriptional regulator
MGLGGGSCCLLSVAPACDGRVRFSPREAEILQLSALGLSDKEIAAVLGISSHTLRAHVSRLYGRLGVHTRAAAVTIWLLAGLPGDLQDRAVGSLRWDKGNLPRMDEFRRSWTSPNL